MRSGDLPSLLMAIFYHKVMKFVIIMGVTECLFSAVLRTHHAMSNFKRWQTDAFLFLFFLENRFWLLMPRRKFAWCVIFFLGKILKIFQTVLSQLAFYVIRHRAVIGQSATLMGRWRPDIDLRRMLTGLLNFLPSMQFSFSFSSFYVVYMSALWIILKDQCHTRQTIKSKTFRYFMLIASLGDSLHELSHPIF